jgi:quercetin dioxygenase-like cupin family protein
MITVDLSREELREAYSYSGMRLRSCFPLSAAAGTEATAVVYFEIESGDHLGRHTDSVEELLLVLEGEGVAVVGDERAEIGPGSIAVVPALAPHEVHATGDTTLRVVGFFAGAEVEHVFDEPIQPIGLSVLTTPMAVPA